MSNCQYMKGETWTIVNFWTEIPSPFLAIVQILSVIRIETYEAKNKRVKPREAIPNLTLLKKQKLTCKQ
jgi:hypothetical protein